MNDRKKSIEPLNELLRGELAAQENYDQVIAKVRDEHPQATQTLVDCQASHKRRAEQLDGYIRRLGGEPSETSGAWGTFAKAFEGAAKLFGDHSAVSALEEGEDHGLNHYRRKMDELPAEDRQFLEQTLMPEQRRTHDAISALQKQV